MTGNFIQDMGSVPHMLRHGIVGPEVHSVKQRESVRRLVENAQKEDKKC